MHLKRKHRHIGVQLHTALNAEIEMEQAAALDGLATQVVSSGVLLGKHVSANSSSNNLLGLPLRTSGAGPRG